MLGKLSIAGAVAAILMIPTPLSAHALLLTPALLFVVPSFGVSRPQGISRVQARRITVAFIGTVRRPKNRVDDRFNSSKESKSSRARSPPTCRSSRPPKSSLSST